MSLWWLLSSALAAGPVYSTDNLLGAMQSELDRAMEQLSLEDQPRPYLVNIEVIDGEVVTTTAQFGAVTSHDAGPYRNSRVEIRVGDHHLDSGNFSGAIADKTLCSPNIHDVTVFKYLVLPRHWQQCIDVRRYKIFSIGAAEQLAGEAVEQLPGLLTSVTVLHRQQSRNQVLAGSVIAQDRSAVAVDRQQRVIGAQAGRGGDRGRLASHAAVPLGDTPLAKELLKTLIPLARQAHVEMRLEHPDRPGDRPGTG